MTDDGVSSASEVAVASITEVLRVLPDDDFVLVTIVTSDREAAREDAPDPQAGGGGSRVLA